MNVYLGAEWFGAKPKANIAEILLPDRTFVFLDESPQTINDGAFAPMPPPGLYWNDVPADRHAQSGTFSFADGHVEVWKWNWPKKGPGARPPASPQDARDITRLNQVLGLDR